LYLGMKKAGLLRLMIGLIEKQIETVLLFKVCIYYTEYR
jgi:hypothetical protein